MSEIATLTLNPAIDTAYEVDQLVPTQKMRAKTESYDPGGGGINVARVLARLGDHVTCYYLAGGATGAALDQLLVDCRFDRERVSIEGATRISTTIFNRESGEEFRVVPTGPTVSEVEWTQCLDRLAQTRVPYLVISGSLAPGVPGDFYARVAECAVRNGTKIVLDSSGSGLKHGLDGGNVFLVKPNARELGDFFGRPLTDLSAIADAAMALVERGSAKLAVVTMGNGGALLARSEGTVHLPALPVKTRSTVGAGDSFTAGMVHALAGGADVLEAFRVGVAAGAAAVLTPGTDLALKDDIDKLLPLVSAS